MYNFMPHRFLIDSQFSYKVEKGVFTKWYCCKKLTDERRFFVLRVDAVFYVKGQGELHSVLGLKWPTPLELIHQVTRGAFHLVKYYINFGSDLKICIFSSLLWEIHRKKELLMGTGQTCFPGWNIPNRHLCSIYCFAWLFYNSFSPFGFHSHVKFLLWSKWWVL